MQLINDIRQLPDDWIDIVIKDRPVVIARDSDYIFSLTRENLESLLEPYKFTAAKYMEADGSITLSLHELDLVVNMPTLKDALEAMRKELKEYAEEYYENFRLYYNSPNRKGHWPYVLKVLLADNLDEIKVMIDA
ncbi:Antitoxin of toxin-antitoxin, RelE / RelB, TA system [Thermosyntropha lipolytica DSM 11003]|uniref:Antitoxin of toxin-antitoxin, RelE / RelB, TA system n=1 Tax=Thermosyntropha lipolytica DSM 11003 TaxID=1123382 RepID=A0A1M5RDG1_9FIRM|nr:hypothetical protein [Thermosyntropha lipolytica]SHH24355.1 Antitoxin of toxin-antitoxin, RelE / RelB, TA system [Thermosyntropha lipolytica DSM 11003]